MEKQRETETETDRQTEEETDRIDSESAKEGEGVG